MPILAMNSINSYDRIPESEDVTPLPRSPNSLKNRFWAPVKISIATLSIIVLLYVVYRYNPISFSTSGKVRIFQTSKARIEYGMEEADVRAWQSFFPGISTIAFGNIDCESGFIDPACDERISTPGKLEIDRSRRFQTILGFGGAFTEASAVNFYRLPNVIRDKIIGIYFGENGIGFSLGRIHINSCDFSLESYSFDNIDGDYNLEYFDSEVTHDNAFILPFIRQAMASSPRTIRLVASPWSPPAWMKVPVEQQQEREKEEVAAGGGGEGNTTTAITETSSTSSMLGSAPYNGLKADDATMSAWALYFVKFIDAYLQKGVPIWAITPQNEPEFAAPWEACKYNASFEHLFIQKYLGPILKAYHPEISILAFDHNKDHLLQWAHTILGMDSNGYVDGMAFHWYGGGDRITDGAYGYDAVNATYHFAPDKILLATEGCSCPNVAIGDDWAWLRAERLAHDVIYDLNSYAQGWIDWNLLVDTQGGPNHIKNYCDASIIVDENFSDVLLQPKLFYYAHISKYVTPKSTRIYSKVVGNYYFAETDPSVYAFIELGAYNCEKSSRQLWNYNQDLKTIELLHLTQNKTVKLCIGRGDANREFLSLRDCTDINSGNMTSSVLSFESSNGSLRDIASGLCMGLAGDVREPGALLKLAPCVGVADNNDANLNVDRMHQIFSFDPQTAELKVLCSDERPLCITAGWPFLSAVAFTRPVTDAISFGSNAPVHDFGVRYSESSNIPSDDAVAREIAIVVVNEASIATSILLHSPSDESNEDTSKDVMGFVIAARSIQTILY